MRCSRERETENMKRTQNRNLGAEEHSDTMTELKNSVESFNSRYGWAEQRSRRQSNWNYPIIGAKIKENEKKWKKPMVLMGHYQVK